MKILLLTLFTAGVQLVNGQNYIPIPNSDAVWIQASYLIGTFGHEHTTITNPLSFGQDTVVSGQSYHKLEGHEIIEWIDGWGNPQAYATGISTLGGYEFLFRQNISAKKVYTYFENQDTLLYDFDLTVGQIYPQTVMNLNYPNLLVMGVDSVQLLDGLYHKKWLLGTDSMDSGYVALIEGVGSTMGFSLPIWPLFEQTGAIMCFKEGSSPIYENWNNPGLIPAQYSEQCQANVSVKELEKLKTQITIFPNPTNGIINFSKVKGVTDISILNSLGQIVHHGKYTESDFQIDLSEFEKGVYAVKMINAEGVFSQKVVLN